MKVGTSGQIGSCLLLGLGMVGAQGIPKMVRPRGRSLSGELLEQV